MNRLKKKLKNREKVFGTTLTAIDWSGIIETLKNDILDFILFDFRA